jgi:hypothetical protein
VLPLTSSTTAHDDGHSRAHESTLRRISASDVAVHRRSGKGGEVYRAVVEVECGPDVGIDTFRGCLVTPETRPLCTSITYLCDNAEDVQGIAWLKKLQHWIY